MTDPREDLERAKDEVAREHRKIEQRTATGRNLGQWFRRTQEENGWRTLIESIARGNS